MPRSRVLKSALPDLKGVIDAHATLRRLCEKELQRNDLGLTERTNLERLLAASEVLALGRLYSVFERGLADIGPHLTRPVIFGTEDSLGTKLDQIGRAMDLPQTFRDAIDRDLRARRNDLLHGRTLVPLVPLETTYDLMKQFLKGCH